MAKRCSSCKRYLGKDNFGKNRWSKDGIHWHCNDCRRKWRKEHKEQIQKSQRKYYNKNREVLRIRGRVWGKEVGRYKRYGITKEIFNKMLERQKNKCKICKESFSTMLSTDIHIDHNHKTDKVRGLLCRKCNQCLGWLEPHWKQASRYLQ